MSTTHRTDNLRAFNALNSNGGREDRKLLAAIRAAVKKQKEAKP